LISSGYSQGLIDSFQDLCAQAEHIALAVKSAGPLNVQGRVRNGRLLPFEINPRFSASTYLRALAGFNEIDIFLQYLVHGIESSLPAIKPGYYLRSLNEVHVPLESIKHD
jgi:carbamoyl-phosphate synthase large subunit